MKVIWLAAVAIVLPSCQVDVPKVPDPVAMLKDVFKEGAAKASKTVWKIENPEFDVRKTDSLVSPYSGLITFRANYLYMDNDFTAEIRLHYAFQDGCWVQKSAESKIDYKAKVVFSDTRNPLLETHARDLATCFAATMGRDTP